MERWRTRPILRRSLRRSSLARSVGRAGNVIEGSYNGMLPTCNTARLMPSVERQTRVSTGYRRPVLPMGYGPYSNPEKTHAR